MFRNILVQSVQQKKTQLFSSVRRNFFSRNVENSEQLTTYLTENKIVDKTVFETFKSMVSEQNKVFLFKIHGFSNTFFLTCRFQVIALTIGCLAHVGFFYKYKMDQIQERTVEHRNKRAKLNFITGALVLFTIGGNILTYALSRRYLKSINYLPKTNQFEFNFYGMFCQDKPYIVELNQVYRVQKKLKDQTVQFAIQNKDCPHTYFSSMGTGWWSNKKLFEYIVDQNPVPESEKPKEKKIKKLKDSNEK